MAAGGAGSTTGRRSLPAGTLTFLAASVGDVDVQQWSDLVVRHGGLLVDPTPTPEGAALAVFTRPADAVMAAVETSSSLGRHGWGWTIRSALHTAAAEPDDGVYPARIVSVCLSLADAGQPSDVLLSSTTAELVRDDLPDGSVLIDLGAVSLRGLSRRLRVLRLHHPDLPDQRGPLRTLDALLHGVPQPATSFVGRAAEIEQTIALLRSTRLVSLVGIGGTGKTRLAIAAIMEGLSTARLAAADGVYYVDLAPVDRPGVVWQAVAHVLGVRERAGATDDVVVLDYLQASEVVFVLDNCEHVLSEVAGVVDRLLDHAPGVRILATSRDPLGGPGERTIAVGPLPVADAVTLFHDRAIAVSPALDPSHSDALVVDICRRLDGLPLSIELVAARADVLTPAEFQAWLRGGGGLGVSGRQPEARHGSVRPAIEWSVERLSPREATLLYRLAVFAGGFDSSAVEAVCADPPIDSADRYGLLTGLLDRSLVCVGDESGRPRHRLLEPVRELARERLEASEESAIVAGRHFMWYRGLAGEAAQAMGTASERAWLDRLDVERDNLRVALHWQGATPDERAEYATALGAFWQARGHWTEGRHELRRCLEEGPSPAVRSQVRLRLGVLEMHLGNTLDAEGLLHGATDELLAGGDAAAAAESLACLAMLYSRLGDHDQARAHGRRGVDVATDAGDNRARGRALDLLAQVEHQAGAFDAVLANQLDALVAFRAARDRNGEANALHGVGRALLALGDLDGARRRIREAHDAFTDLGDPFGRAVTGLGLGRVEHAAGRPRASLDALGPALAGMTELSAPRGIGHAIQGIALAVLELGQSEQAVRLLGASAQLLEDIHMRLNPAEELQYAEALGTARRLLGDNVVEELWQSGQALATASAVNLCTRLIAACTAPVALPPPGGSERRWMFRAEGDQIRAEFEGEAVLITRSKGTDYLARLLAHPNEEFHALDLASGPGTESLHDQGIGPALDSRAKQAYRRRLAELDEDLDEADRLGDSDRAARAQIEIDALAKQLSAAIGAFGRDRSTGSAGERARQSVTKAIKSAIARIQRRAPALSQHLDTTVRTGSFCVYAPGTPVRWETDNQT